MVKKKRPTDKNRPKIGHRPRKYTDLDVFQKRIEEFFADCDTRGKPYTVTGLARSLIISREQLLRYEDERPGFSEAVKAAREKIQQDVEEGIIIGGKSGKNVVGLIFWLKNNAGWSDLLKLSGPDGEPLALEMSSLEVAARIATIFELARKRKEEQDIEAALKQIPEKVGDAKL
jgi:hypothetical protein